MQNLKNKDVNNLFHSWLKNKYQKRNHIDIYSLSYDYIDQIYDVMQGCLDGKVTFGKVCQKLHFYIVNNIDYTEYSWLERISVDGTKITEANMKKQYGNEIGLQKWNQYIERQRFHMSEEFCIQRYGEEEGKKRWKKYCDRQAYTCSFEYFAKTRGMTKEQFEQFNKSRAVTEENMIKRYGEEEGKKRWKKYCRTHCYINTEEYFIDKYGIEEGKKKYKELNRLKSQNLELFINKYGEDMGIKLWLERTIEKNVKHALFYSKISQELFIKLEEIYKDKFEKFYYGIKNTNNGEFHIYDEVNKRFYFYDFVIEDIKFAIEFNGDYWHANPNIYKPDELVNIRNKKLKACEIWEKDNYKNNKLKELGYNLIIVWENDYRKNSYEVIERIKKEIEKTCLNYNIKL